MQRLTAHKATVDEEDEDDGVELESGTLEQQPPGDLIEDPAAAHPPGHDGVDSQGGGDGRALEVAGLSGRILGDRRRRHVEPRQPREPAQHEHRQQHRVERRAQPDRECHTGRGEAERDLLVVGANVVSQTDKFSSGGLIIPSPSEEEEGREIEQEDTYEISQGIQLLTHHAALLSPPRHSSVHEIEEQAEREEGEGEVQVALVSRVAEAVP